MDPAEFFPYVLFFPAGFFWPPFDSILYELSLSSVLVYLPHI